MSLYPLNGFDKRYRLNRSGPLPVPVWMGDFRQSHTGGNKLYDFSGRGNHGTLSNAAWGVSRTSPVIASDGASNGYVDVLPPLTVSQLAAGIGMGCWFDTTTITVGQMLMVFENAASTAAGDWIRLTAQGNVAGDPIRAQTTHGLTGSGAAVVDTTTGFAVGTRHFACCNATSTGVEVWLDMAGYAAHVSAVTMGVLDQFTLGYWRGRTAQPLFGNIDTPMVFTRPLSLSEWGAIFQSQLNGGPGVLGRSFPRYYPTAVAAGGIAIFRRRIEAAA